MSADAGRVTCHPAPDTPDAVTQHLYLNQVLPLALSKQGKLVFHASAVEVADGAIAFVAESGRGKSTLAASFAIDGFRFLTDDGLVVEPSAQGHVASAQPSVDPPVGGQRGRARSSPERCPRPPCTSLPSRASSPAGISSSATSRGRCVASISGRRQRRPVVFQRLTGSEAMVEWVKHSFLLDVEERRGSFRISTRWPASRTSHPLPPGLPQALRGSRAPAVGNHRARQRAFPALAFHNDRRRSTATVTASTLPTLCALLRGESPEWPSSVDDDGIDEFLRDARYHGVTPLLDARFRATAAPGWPTAIRRACHEDALVQSMCEFTRRTELARVFARWPQQASCR